MPGFERVLRERDGVQAERVLQADFAVVLVHPEPAELPRAEWLRSLPDYVISNGRSSSTGPTSTVTAPRSSNECGCKPSSRAGPFGASS